MDIREIRSDRVGESYFEIDHPTGLKIFVYPKEGYNSTYAIFGTHYGSIHNSFRKNSGDVISVPDGIAHFLEHKLFECEEGDAFARYAKTGANANAYTSFDRTCYLFSCTDHFEESFEILLDFVTKPYFTKETVQKEQGIIGQEIKMYDDSPDWCCMFNMLSKMYEHHPVRIDIAGTVESIAKITPEYLYSCYHTFYNLHNMALTVVGNVGVDTVLSVADRMLQKSEDITVESFFEPEPVGVSEHFVEQKMPVGLPMFNLGFKEDSSRLLSTEEIAYTDILLIMLASQNSPMYRDLLDSGLINSSFSHEFFEGEGFCVTIFAGESREPEKAAQMIKKYIREAKKNGLSEEDFEIAKRAVYGENLAAFNSVSGIANAMMDYYFSDRELYAYIDAVANTSFEDVTKRLDSLMNEDKAVLSVVRS